MDSSKCLLIGVPFCRVSGFLGSSRGQPRPCRVGFEALVGLKIRVFVGFYKKKTHFKMPYLSNFEHFLPSKPGSKTVKRSFGS